MMVSPYRVTPEDLVDLDSKTRNALVPLLEALNVTLPQLVQAVALAGNTQTMSGTFAAEAGGSAYVDVTPKQVVRPYSVVLDFIRRTDSQPMATAHAFSWLPTPAGVRLLFIGLDPGRGYSFGVTFK